MYFRTLGAERKYFKNRKCLVMGQYVGNVACKDIAKHLKEEKIKNKDEFGDVWVFSPFYMLNTEVRQLNARLGLNKVNKKNNWRGKQ